MAGCRAARRMAAEVPLRRAGTNEDARAAARGVTSRSEGEAPEQLGPGGAPFTARPGHPLCSSGRANSASMGEWGSLSTHGSSPTGAQQARTSPSLGPESARQERGARAGQSPGRCRTRLSRRTPWDGLDRAVQASPVLLRPHWGSQGSAFPTLPRVREKTLGAGCCSASTGAGGPGSH